MIHDDEDYADLVAMTQLHLLQEYSRRDWLMTDSTTYEYFKNYASTRSSHKISREVRQDVPSDSPSNARKHCEVDKAKTYGGEGSAKDCSPPPKDPEKCSLPLESPRPAKQPTPSIPPEPTKNPAPSSPSNKSTPEPQPTTASEKPFTSIELHPLSSPPTTDFSSIRKTLMEKFPAQRILDEIPDDVEAKKISQQWKKQSTTPAVAILSSDEHPKHRVFLNNLAKAIEVCYCPASVISAEDLQTSKGLHLLITSKKIENMEIETLQIASIEEYLRDPLLKAELWEEIGKKNRFIRKFGLI